MAATLLLAGCGGGSSDKAGGKAKVTPVVLEMANGLGSSSELDAFAAAVRRTSNGSLRIAFRNNWRRGSARYETGLIRDVRAGKADLGWAGTRAFDDVGVRSFDALHAPLLVDNYALQRKVLESPLVGRMLAGLERSGLVGIGIVPGPLRKPLGKAPLVGPRDYRGKTLGIARSPVAEETLRALGATAREMTPGGAIDNVDGVEQSLLAIEGDRYDAVAPYLTANVNLWPRPLVLFMSKRTSDRLSDEQRDALRAAAESAATVPLARYQSGSSGILCNRGVAFVAAGASDLAALRRSVRPVYEDLERDRTTKAAIAAIRDMRAGATAVPDAPKCANASSRAAVPGKPTPLDGRYRMTSTAADLRDAGAPESDIHADNYGVWETTLNRGRFAQKQPAGASAEGTYTVAGDTVTFTVTAGTAGDQTETRPGEVYTFRWSRYRDQLKLAAVPGKASPPTWFVLAWRRIGDATAIPGRRATPIDGT